ncbi:MAG: hypothetical protein AAF581_05845 [Planctomycetota bacterium]
MRALFVGMLLIGATVTSSAWSLDRIVRKDGSVVTGEVVGFRDGRYTVKVGDGTVEVAAQDVRTILEGRSAAAQNPHMPTVVGQIDVQRLLESISMRRRPAIAPESRLLFDEALAQVVRGEWDLAIRRLGQLLDQEPEWSDPQILNALLLAERGDAAMALQVALRLETTQPDDDLAQRVAAEVYRRAQYPERSARTLERVLRRDTLGARVEYDLARLWWSVDPAKAASHWQAFLQSDPEMRSSWCSEGQYLQRARLALSIRDWAAAQMALDALEREAPWAAAQVVPWRWKVLESRLDSAESGGRLEEALLACESLLTAQPDRAEEYRARLTALRSFVLNQALASHSFEELRGWCRRRSHLLDPQDTAWRAKLSARFQELGARSFAEGQLVKARLAFLEGKRWDAESRPHRRDAIVDQMIERVRDDLLVGLRAKALEEVAVLRDAFPELREQLLPRLVGVYRDVLTTSLAPDQLNAALLQLQGTLRPQPLQPLGVDGNPIVVARGDSEKAKPLSPSNELVLDDGMVRAMERYYPHQPGTRWVYECGNGRREERRIVAVEALPTGGRKITIRVEGEAIPDGFLTHAYLIGTDLLLNFPAAPPGEYALRYPLTNGGTWSWKKGIFRHTRRLSRPGQMVHLPFGTFKDAIVVDGENAVVEGSDATYKAQMRMTYVAGIGLTSVECENPELARQLVEFYPPQSRFPLPQSSEAAK